MKTMSANGVFPDTHIHCASTHSYKVWLVTTCQLCFLKSHLFYFLTLLPTMLHHSHTNHSSSNSYKICLLTLIPTLHSSCHSFQQLLYPLQRDTHGQSAYLSAVCYTVLCYVFIQFRHIQNLDYFSPPWVIIASPKCQIS
jgi:hypothetical protein